MDVTEAPIIQSLLHRFHDHVLESHTYRGDQTVIVKPEAIIPVLTFLKDDPSLDFTFLMDLTVVDYLTYPEPRAARYEVVYHLYSLRFGHRVRIKIPVKPGDTVPTASSLWESANWAEREAWEFFGIVFEGHPNLKRLLTHKDFHGFPLRKDFPLKRRQPLEETDTLVDEMDERLRFKGLK